MAVDLRAVAELSGVSVSTVSRALRGSDRVSPSTRAKVARAAASLNYRPNAAARGLRTRQSSLIGVVMPNLVSVTFVNLCAHLQAGFRAQGYEIVLSVTNGDPEQETNAFDTLRGHQVDGIVSIGSYSGTDYLREFMMPTVHLFNSPQNPAGDCITINEFASTREAIGYFIDLGHKRIGCINGASENTRDGYIYALREHNLEVDDSLIYIDKYDTETGRQGVEQLFTQKNPPTAVFFGCYENWLSGIPELFERGLSIPDDVSIICRDDADMLRWWRPAITAVDIDVSAMARLAVARLADAVTSGDNDLSIHPGRYEVATRLILRDSARKVGHR